MQTQQILAALWDGANGAPSALDRVHIAGAAPILPSIFRVDEVAGATIAAVGTAAAELWQQRTGATQEIRVDLRAAAAAFRSEGTVDAIRAAEYLSSTPARWERAPGSCWPP